MAKSQKDAVAALVAVGVSNMTLHHFRQFASDTGNETELETATEPGVVWWEEDRYKGNFQRWETL
jgi:hypothetical protein